MYIYIDTMYNTCIFFYFLLSLFSYNQYPLAGIYSTSLKCSTETITNIKGISNA